MERPNNESQFYVKFIARTVQNSGKDVCDLNLILNIFFFLLIFERNFMQTVNFLKIY